MEKYAALLYDLIWQRYEDTYDAVKDQYPSSYNCLTELSISDYEILKKFGYRPEKYCAYPLSGKRGHSHVGYAQDIYPKTYDTGDEYVCTYTVGEGIARMGYYKIVSISEDRKSMKCYYNYRGYDNFIEEEIVIFITPLLNSVAGPKGCKDIEFKVGDVIYVYSPSYTHYDERIDDRTYKVHWVIPWKYIPRFSEGYETHRII